jgi:DNA-directed RNA polymerase specialized sigma subunit
MQAYCMKCRKKREMKNGKAIKMKNGRLATQGVCPVCGTKMFRIGNSEGQTAIRMTDRERVESVLAKLPAKDQKVIRLGFGFDGRPLTLQEIREVLSREGGGANISLDQVRRMEAKALQKLRYPTRYIRLRDIKTRGDAPEYRLVRAVFRR